MWRMKRSVFQAVQVIGAREQTKMPASSLNPALSLPYLQEQKFPVLGSILDKTVLDHRRIHARKIHTIGGN